MKWNHILEEQPKNGSYIIVVEKSRCGCFNHIGLQYYNEKEPFAEIIDYNTRHGIDHPDFWWMYEKDFLWPKNRT